MKYTMQVVITTDEGQPETRELACVEREDPAPTPHGLQDIQAVRRDDHYYRKYLGGGYGAVPRLG